MLFGAGSAYLPCMWAASILMTKLSRRSMNLLSTSINSRLAFRNYSFSITLSNVLFLSFPILHTAKLAFLVLSFFTPLMGRSGHHLPGDLLIAVILALSYFLVTFLMNRFNFLFHHGSRERIVLLGLFACSFLAAGILSPYSPDRPKRVFLQHTLREYYSEDGSLADYDSGYWWAPLDSISIDVLHEPYLRYFEKRYVECGSIYCNLPFWLPLQTFVDEDDMWYIPAPVPQFPKKPSLTVASSRYDPTSNIRRVEVKLLGTDHMNLYFNVDEGRRELIKAWSFGEVPSHQRDTFFVMICSSDHVASFDFWIEVEGKEASIPLAFSSHDFEPVLHSEVEKFKIDVPSWADMLVIHSYWSRIVL